jgi:octopine/nopaline transport system permease protein
VTGIAHKLISQTFRAIEIFIVAGAIYLVINFLVTRLIGWAERRLSPDRTASRAIGAGEITTHA